MPFPMERGMINVFDRQARPFDHETNGRGVIFESDDRLSRNSVSRAVEGIGDRLKSLGQDALSASARFLGIDTREQAIEEGKGLYAELMSERAATSQQQVATLSGELTASRPSASYIENLNLQAVPVPEGAKQGQQPDPQAQQRSDSFKAMEDKARDLNPSASIGEASESGRKAVSGMVVDMDDETDGNILQSFFIQVA
jgi:hypothetical protein